MTATFRQTITFTIDRSAKTMKKLFLIWTVALGSTVVHGQTADKSVVFHKKKNPDKTFTIPFNEQLVIIKPKNGKRIRGIISNCNDSTLTVKTYSTDKSVNDNILKVTQDHSLSSKEKNRKIDSLRFTNEQQIKLSDIDHIGINKWTRKGKRWIFVTTYLGGISAYVFWVSYQEALEPNSVNIPHPLVFIGYAGVLYFIQHKTINLDKWTVTSAPTDKK